MGITATTIAKKSKLKRNADWRANARKESDKFKASEQMSRDKYNEFTKLSRAFVRAYPNEFKTFLLAKQGNVVARQSFGLPRHMPATMPAEGGLRPSTFPEGSSTPPVQLPDFRSSSVSSGRIPSAQELEGRRLQPTAAESPSGNALDILGIRRD
jgi:hypothetical protein